MKKSNAIKKDKDKDRVRLECLTKSKNQDIWSYDGKVFPEHVCGYGLGIYYEVNFKMKAILVEYYKKGELYYKYKINID